MRKKEKVETNFSGAGGITNKGSFRDCNLEQKDSKSGERFQIKSNRFQVGAKITNRGKTDFK